MPKDDLSHIIDQWTNDGKNPVEVLERAKTYDIAVAAYEAAVKAEPYAFIRLSHGARIIRERKART